MADDIISTLVPSAHRHLLHDVVWTEIVWPLEDPRLIQKELERRLMAARESDPTKRRDEALRRDLIRIRKGIPS
jgi:site-specific DNA recombinase